MCDSLAVHQDVHRPAVHLVVVFVSVLPREEEEEEEEKRQHRVWAACQPSAAVELSDALTMSSLASLTDVTANTKISGMAVVYQSSADTSGINCTDTHADVSVFEIESSNGALPAKVIGVYYTRRKLERKIFDFKHRVARAAWKQMCISVVGVKIWEENTTAVLDG